MAEAGPGELKLGTSPGFGPLTGTPTHHVGEQGFQAAPALAERSIEQQLAVAKEQVKNHVHDRNIGVVDREAGPEFSLRLRLPAPQPRLKLGERQRAVSAPADDFAIENEFSRESLQGREELGKFLDFVERTRKESRLPTAFVGLGTNPIVLVFHERAFGKVFHGFLGALGRARQHEPNRVEEAQLGRVKPAGGSQAQRGADIARKHVGALDLRQRPVKRVGDRLLDQAFLQSNSQVAGDDLDDVLGLQPARAAKQRLELRQFLGGAPAGGQSFERRPHILEGERLRSLFTFKDFLGHGPEVTVLAIDGFENARLRFRQASQRLPDERRSDPEDKRLDAGKGSPCEEEGGARSIFDRKRTQIVACQTHLFSFLGGRGHGLAESSKAAHRWAASSAGLQPGTCRPKGRRYGHPSGHVRSWIPLGFLL